MLEMCAVPAASDHSELTCAGMEDAPLGSLDDSLIELLLVNAQSSIETRPADNSGTSIFSSAFNSVNFQKVLHGEFRDGRRRML